MKQKNLGTLVLALLLVFSLSACNSKTDLPEGLELQDLGNRLTNELEFQDKDLALLPDELRERYMNQVDFSQVKNSCIYAGGGFIAEEIALFEANSPAAAEAIEKSMQARFDYFRTSFGNYTPEQLKNLEDPVLIREGNYVFAVICQDNAKAKTIVKDWIKAKS